MPFCSCGNGRPPDAAWRRASDVASLAEPHAWTLPYYTEAREFLSGADAATMARLVVMPWVSTFEQQLGKTLAAFTPPPLQELDPSQRQDPAPPPAPPGLVPPRPRRAPVNVVLPANMCSPTVYHMRVIPADPAIDPTFIIPAPAGSAALRAPTLFPPNCAGVVEPRVPNSEPRIPNP